MLFLPARLRQARDAAGLTLDQVADAVGRSNATICRYETGRIPLTSAMLGRLAEVYHRPVADFFSTVDGGQAAEVLAGAHDGRR